MFRFGITCTSRMLTDSGARSCYFITITDLYYCLFSEYKDCHLFVSSKTVYAAGRELRIKRILHFTIIINEFRRNHIKCMQTFV